MQDKPKPTNITSNSKHARQVVWQIWAPLVLMILLVLSAAVLIVLGAGSGEGKTGQWASISIIWMIMPLIFAGILFLIFTAGMIFLLARALRILPVYTRVVQVYVQIFGIRITNLLDGLVTPIMWINSRSAGLTAIWKHRKEV